MFDKLKNLAKLKSLKDEADKEIFEIERNGVKVAINGGLAVMDIKLNPNLDITSQEKILKECLSEAFSKAQMAMARKFSGLL